MKYVFIPILIFGISLFFYFLFGAEFAMLLILCCLLWLFIHVLLKGR